MSPQEIKVITESRPPGESYKTPEVSHAEASKQRIEQLNKKVENAPLSPEDNPKPRTGAGARTALPYPLKPGSKFQYDNLARMEQLGKKVEKAPTFPEENSKPHAGAGAGILLPYPLKPGGKLKSDDLAQSKLGKGSAGEKTKLPTNSKFIQDVLLRDPALSRQAKLTVWKSVLNRQTSDPRLKQLQEKLFRKGPHIQERVRAALYHGIMPFSPEYDEFVRKRADAMSSLASAKQQDHLNRNQAVISETIENGKGSRIRNGERAALLLPSMKTDPSGLSIERSTLFSSARNRAPTPVPKESAFLNAARGEPAGAAHSHANHVPLSEEEQYRSRMEFAKNRGMSLRSHSQELIAASKSPDLRDEPLTQLYSISSGELLEQLHKGFGSKAGDKSPHHQADETHKDLKSWSLPF